MHHDPLWATIYAPGPRQITRNARRGVGDGIDAAVTVSLGDGTTAYAEIHARRTDAGTVFHVRRCDSTAGVSSVVAEWTVPAARPAGGAR